MSATSDKTVVIVLIILGMILLYSYLQAMPDLEEEAKHQKRAGHVRNNQKSLMDELGLDKPTPMPSVGNLTKS
eukprot:CAMPEP_0184299926 /NCGR_PEP_ID=MMETSP1049-20130417/10449_1 /TAXON_ID=77928 /ORGANISM="Proteomonas sulcata, Strain CCMP704" /LENGTH=72 /DNA_ID=CAMNT_0026610507 /DNA_START=338 /DNA_END=556 /DNA_ORIENTATION=+